MENYTDEMSAHTADQNSGLRRIILVLLALGVVSMVSLIVAGATSLISLADRIHPVAGTARAAEGNVGSKARGLFADVALAVGE